MKRLRCPHTETVQTSLGGLTVARCPWVGTAYLIAGGYERYAFQRHYMAEHAPEPIEEDDPR
jgi:hypothetical protein